MSQLAGSLVQSRQQPAVHIVEQPSGRGLRFRYRTERRASGPIHGENSNSERFTYPKIKVTNLDGRPMMVVVSCMTKRSPVRPHPHGLVGKNCKRGIYSLQITGTDTIQFSSLGIQCAKINEVEKALKERAEIKVDPFANASYDNMKEIDLGVVRLCFQVFIIDNGQCSQVQPVVSNCIYDEKMYPTCISICHLSQVFGSAVGGDEIILLCDKVDKNDIKVRFFEERSDSPYWEAEADFGAEDVHRQYAIRFKTPPYRDQTIQQPVNVQLQLYRPKDNQCSSPKLFLYIPHDPDPDDIEKKRKRKTIENHTCITEAFDEQQKVSLDAFALAFCPNCGNRSPQDVCDNTV